MTTLTHSQDCLCACRIPALAASYTPEKGHHCPCQSVLIQGGYQTGSDGNTHLFGQPILFDLPAGLERKRQALERFEHTGASWLARARAVAHEHCIQWGKVTSDDVLAVVGMPKDAHRNLVGAMWNTSEWRAVGRTATKRPSGHGRFITVWRLR